MERTIGYIELEVQRGMSMRLGTGRQPNQL